MGFARFFLKAKFLKKTPFLGKICFFIVLGPFSPFFVGNWAGKSVVGHLFFSLKIVVK